MAKKTAAARLVQHKVNLGKDVGTKLIRLDPDVHKLALKAQKVLYPKGAPLPTMQDWLGKMIERGSRVTIATRSLTDGRGK